MTAYRLTLRLPDGRVSQPILKAPPGDDASAIQLATQQAAHDGAYLVRVEALQRVGPFTRRETIWRREAPTTTPWRRV